MPRYEYLITCAGWEDRFFDGTMKTIETNDIDNLVVLVISEFLNKTKQNLERLENTQKSLKKKRLEISLLDDAGAWNQLSGFFSEHKLNDTSVCVDITTMPRFLIWFLMHYLDVNSNAVDYVYYKPDSYEKCNWLTSDAETPRLVFKHSGIYLPDRPTILIIQTGFDIERVNQMIYAYEPEKVLLASQTGDQFDNSIENIKKHKEHLKFQNLEFFEIDAFNSDFGFSKIEEVIVKLKDDYNIVLSSFGPKPTSLAMFYLNKKHPEIGLSYVLVKNYNSKYSHGTNFNKIINISLDGLM